MLKKWFLKKMKQVWVNWESWEDYHAGMWEKVAAMDFDRLLKLAIEFTGDHVAYGNAMQRVVFAWPQTMLHNLTNTSLNQRAFVGHCAACFEHQLPESVTRAAWAYLSEAQRIEANKQAQNAIDSWRLWHINKGQYKIPFPEYAENLQ